MMPDPFPAAEELTDAQVEEKVNKANRLVAVLFYATWCPHCHHFRPTFDKVSETYGDGVMFFVADAEVCRKFAETFGIIEIPTLVFLRGGQQVDIHVGGMNEDELKAKLDELAA